MPDWLSTNFASRWLDVIFIFVGLQRGLSNVVVVALDQIGILRLEGSVKPFPRITVLALLLIPVAGRLLVRLGARCGIRLRSAAAGM